MTPGKTSTFSSSSSWQSFFFYIDSYAGIGGASIIAAAYSSSKSHRNHIVKVNTCMMSNSCRSGYCTFLAHKFIFPQKLNCIFIQIISNGNRYPSIWEREGAGKKREYEPAKRCVAKHVKWHLAKSNGNFQE